MSDERYDKHCLIVLVPTSDSMKLNTFSSLQRATLDILSLIDVFQFLHQKVISDVEIGINIGMKNINRIGSQEESKHSDKKKTIMS